MSEDSNLPSDVKSVDSDSKSTDAHTDIDAKDIDTAECLSELTESGIEMIGSRTESESACSDLSSNLNDGDRNIAKKPSGIKPPSKIARSCCIGPPKAGPPPPTPKQNGASHNDIIRKISEDLNKKRLTDASIVLTEDTDSFIIGQRVWVGGTKPGQIAYIGDTQFAPGEWAGIVLDEPIGKNDGSVAGTRYFQCEARRGVFSRLTRLTRTPLPQAFDDCVAQYASSASSGKPPRRGTSPTGSSYSTTSSLRRPQQSMNTSSTSLASTPTVELKIGDRVIVRSSATTGSKAGILRFVGQTNFAPGEWCGVELDDPIGKNDGTVDGTRYFDCQPFYGLFAPTSKVSRSPSTRRPGNCVVHRTTIRRAGSRESLNSTTTSVVSSVRTAASSRVRLGVNSLTTPTSSMLKRTPPPKSSSTPLATKQALQFDNSFDKTTPEWLYFLMFVENDFQHLLGNFIRDP